MSSNIRQMLEEHNVEGITQELLHCLIVLRTCPEMTPEMAERVDIAIKVITTVFPRAALKAVEEALAHHQTLDKNGEIL